MRFKFEDGTVRNFAFNPLAISWLAAAIADIAERLGWSMHGEALHPDSVPFAMANPDPTAEVRWEREWKKTKVATPDASAYSQAAKTVAMNGDGALDSFAVALVLEDGGTATLRMSPLVAWELSGAVHDIGNAQSWWSDLGNVLRGRIIK